MALPTTYLSKTNDFKEIMDAVLSVAVPEYFDFSFLSKLGFKDANNKNYITLFKALKLIHGNKVPTERYHKILHPIEGKMALAAYIKDSYADVFEEREDAQNMSAHEAKIIFSKLCPRDSNRVIEQKSRTFRYLCSYASWQIPYSHMQNETSSDFPDALFQQMLEYFNTYLKDLNHPRYHENNINSERLAKLPPDNEYELQHYMYTYLKPVFRDIRAEKVIEGGSIPDLSISNLNVCIELKYVGVKSNITRLTTEVASDLWRYKKYKYIYFYIYDMQRLIRDPHSFKMEFEALQEEQCVRVIIVQDI